MWDFFGFIVILSTIHKLNAYHNCSSYHILLEDTIFGDEIVPNPDLLDTAVFKSLNSSIPKECYIGFSCLESSTECAPIMSKKVLYGPDTRLAESVTEKTTSTSTTTTSNPHEDADKFELNAKCLHELKHYLTSENCEEKNDTMYKSSAFYHCNTLPYEDCGRTILDGHSSSNLTRENGKNCKSFIMHIRKLYFSSSNFIPHPHILEPAHFETVPCIDFTNTCLLDFNCSREGKSCADVYRYEPSENKNNTECLSATEIFTSKDTAVEIEPSKDFTNATSTKAPTTITSTRATEAATNYTNAITAQPSISTASTIKTEAPTDYTNATTAKIPTSTSMNETETNSTKATTTERTSTTDTSIKTSTHSSNGTIPKTNASTAPTTVTETPTAAIKETDKTKTKNVDLTNSEFYANEGLKGYVYTLLGNTSETNFIVYIVLICIALFVCGMLFCLVVMTCKRCNKKRKYAVEGREVYDSDNDEQTIPMDIMNIIGTAEPTDEYFLRNTSNKLRGSMRSCPERKSYIKSEVD